MEKKRRWDSTWTPKICFGIKIHSGKSAVAKARVTADLDLGRTTDGEEI